WSNQSPRGGKIYTYKRRNLPLTSLGLDCSLLPPKQVPLWCQRSPASPPSPRPLCVTVTTHSHAGVPLLKAAAHRPHAASFLTRGRRATACCTRSFTARNAHPTPSSADMLPALHIPREPTPSPRPLAALGTHHLPVPPSSRRVNQSLLTIESSHPINTHAA
uniref:Uncharacterized protein n=1 Tax=Theropithecus gelada TaxID=9565 RepID=A0A8D2EQ68_THEGE